MNYWQTHDGSPTSRSPVRHKAGATKRFEFGKNWRSFLKVVDESRVRAAEGSLTELLGVEELKGQSFLDIGCGSGLFSLAARRLGASVVSFDVDAESVACAMKLKNEFFDADVSWIVQLGSVLDEQCMASLGQFDIVYAWGVLHHTGAMWHAVENALATVAPGGRLVLALYNDQGWKSSCWYRVKKIYCSGTAGRLAVLGLFVPGFVIREFCADLVRLRNPMSRYVDYKRQRGMSRTHDWLDWLGGFPFEVAKPEEVIEFCQARGFVLEKLVSCGNALGNNQFAFRRT